jgi:hypothetical protein
MRPWSSTSSIWLPSMSRSHTWRSTITTNSGSSRCFRSAESSSACHWPSSPTSLRSLRRGAAMAGPPGLPIRCACAGRFARCRRLSWFASIRTIGLAHAQAGTVAQQVQVRRIEVAGRQLLGARRARARGRPPAGALSSLSLSAGAQQEFEFDFHRVSVDEVGRSAAHAYLWSQKLFAHAGVAARQKSSMLPARMSMPRKRAAGSMASRNSCCGAAPLSKACAPVCLDSFSPRLVDHHRHVQIGRPRQAKHLLQVQLARRGIEQSRRRARCR